MKRPAFFGALIAAIVTVVCASPASAQATRTWVSGVGDDANPCSRTAPCKTFAGAIAKTAASGEIDCLDPGGFGALTITKAITILCEPVSNGGVLVAGTNGIVVAAGATDQVVLQGLDFEGIDMGLNGVQVNSGLQVDIIHCTIRDFTLNGVNVTSSTAGTRVFIKDSYILDNNGGAYVQGNGVANALIIVDTLIDNNTNFAAQAIGSANKLFFARSIFSGSPTGLSLVSGATATSFGPSSIITGGISPYTTQAFQ